MGKLQLGTELEFVHREMHRQFKLDFSALCLEFPIGRDDRP